MPVPGTRAEKTGREEKTIIIIDYKRITLKNHVIYATNF